MEDTAAALFSSSEQASAYASNRPTYPQDIYDEIFKFCDGGRDLAVDIATGSGQAATALAAHFVKVIAQDGSTAQLSNAALRPNIEYACADAHATGLPSSCADLVSVAQGLHWFDHERFYLEVRRILKPGGAFAAWTYTLPTLIAPDHPAQAALLRLYKDVLAPYWAPGRRHVDACYRGIEPGSEHFETVEWRQLSMQYTQTVSQLLGYLRSWSAYQTYRQQHPAAPDPLLTTKQELLEALQTASMDAELTVTMPLTLLLAKGPRPV